MEYELLDIFRQPFSYDVLHHHKFHSNPGMHVQP